MEEAVTVRRLAFGRLALRDAAWAEVVGATRAGRR